MIFHQNLNILKPVTMIYSCKSDEYPAINKQLPSTATASTVGPCSTIGPCPTIIQRAWYDLGHSWLQIFLNSQISNFNLLMLKFLIIYCDSNFHFCDFWGFSASLIIPYFVDFGHFQPFWVCIQAIKYVSTSVCTAFFLHRDTFW